MIFSLQTEHAALKIDLSLGGKILLLEFFNQNSTTRVIQHRPEENFYLSGSYILFPWVNRISSPILKFHDRILNLENFNSDQNGLPIHGFFSESPRKIIKETHNSITIAPIQFHPDFPNFHESFILNENELICKTEFWNPTSQVQAFAYGYHPYLELGKPLDELELIIEPELWIPLDDRLLPTQEVVSTNQVLPFSSLKGISLDHLFWENKPKDSKITLFDPKTKQSVSCIGKHSSTPEQISLPFFQVYTHPSRNSIAIEPQTSPGDVFAHTKFQPILLKPNSSKWGEWNISYNENN